MDLSQPHRIEPPALGRVDLLEGDPESVLLGRPGGPLKLVKHAELERHHLPPSFPSATLARSHGRCAGSRASPSTGCETRGFGNLRDETPSRRVKKANATPL